MAQRVRMAPARTCWGPCLKTRIAQLLLPCSHVCKSNPAWHAPAPCPCNRHRAQDMSWNIAAHVWAAMLMPALSERPGAACAELPRDVRDALVSWNHATDYDLPAYSTYAGGKGKGLFEKTYDLGKLPSAMLGALEVVTCFGGLGPWMAAPGRHADHVVRNAHACNLSWDVRSVTARCQPMTSRINQLPMQRAVTCP